MLNDRNFSCKVLSLLLTPVNGKKDGTSADVLLEKKWRERSTREKAEIITAFLNECGEHASWEEWRDFFTRATGERYWMDTFN